MSSLYLNGFLSGAQRELPGGQSMTLMPKATHLPTLPRQSGQDQTPVPDNPCGQPLHCGTVLPWLCLDSSTPPALGGLGEGGLAMLMEGEVGALREALWGP